MFSTLGYYISLPFAWLMRIFYNITGSYGWALILFSLAVKLVMLPFQMKSKKSMMRMNQFQPKMKEIQTKYANNQVKMNEELQLLYAEEGINPMSGCLWSLLPIFIIWPLYAVIRQPLSRFMLLNAETIEKIRTIAAGLGYTAAETAGRASFYEEINLTQFISQHFENFSGVDGVLNMSYNFLGVDLSVIPQTVWKQLTTGGWPVIGLVLIPFVSAALSLLQSHISMTSNGQRNDGNDTMARQTRTMMYMMPLMSLWIGFTLPAALGIYWIANSVLQTVQDFFLGKYYKQSMEREETEKERKKREERVAKMMAAREQQRQYHEAAQNRSTGKTGGKGQGGKKQEKQTEKREKRNSTTEAGRVGDRPYARGRSYNPEHYGD